MDIEYLSKTETKEQIYRVYEAVTDNYKTYHKITRKKCLERIQEAYQDKEILKRFITDYEFELLREVYKNKYLPKNFMHEDLIRRYLLVDYDLNPSCVCINPDIIEVIKPYLIGDVVRDGYDRYDEFIIGLVRYFGVISYEELFMYLEVYVGNYDEETMFDHISTSPIINYLFLCPEEYVLCCYDLFENYEEILINREEIEHSMVLPEKSQLIAIGHNRMDINHPEIKKAVELILKLYYFQQCNIVDMLTLDAHLSEDFYFLEEFLKMILNYKDEEIEIYEKAYACLPSASNYGLPQKFVFMQEQEQFEIDVMLQNEKQENAHLTSQQADLFYKLYLSLFEYINDKYQICPHVKEIVGVPIDPKDALEIRKVLIENLDEIEFFIRSNKYDLSDEEKTIVRNFKYMKFAHFVAIKHEKNHTILMDGENFYRVKGVRANISEILENFQLPVIVDTLLVPFNGEIIFDGLLQPFPIHLGAGYKKIISDNLKKGYIQSQLIKYN